MYKIAPHNNCVPIVYRKWTEYQKLMVVAHEMKEYLLDLRYCIEETRTCRYPYLNCEKRYYITLHPETLHPESILEE
jgi:hypothetical protein